MWQLTTHTVYWQSKGDKPELNGNWKFGTLKFSLVHGLCPIPLKLYTLALINGKHIFETSEKSLSACCLVILSEIWTHGLIDLHGFSDVQSYTSAMTFYSAITANIGLNVSLKHSQLTQRYSDCVQGDGSHGTSRQWSLVSYCRFKRHYKNLHACRKT